MAFIDKISEDLTAAMRAKQQLRLDTLRMAKAALMNREVEKKRSLDDAESQQVVVGMIKQRRDSIEQYEKAGRQELVDKETAEIAVIETYLPQAASSDEIEQAVLAAIAETGATSMKDMGKVMKAAQAALSGKNADGRQISEIVKSKLS